MIGFPKAWSPGIEGTLEAPVVYFDAKTEAEFAKFKGKLKGAIVLVSPIREVAARLEPLAARKTDSELLALADAAEPTRSAAVAARPAAPGPGTGRSGRRSCERAGRARRSAGRRRRAPVRSRSRRCRRHNRPAGAIHDSRDAGPDGAPAEEDPVPGRPGNRHARRAEHPGRRRHVLRPVGEHSRAGPFGGGGGADRCPQRQRLRQRRPQDLPQVVLAKEHYNRLVRMCEAGENVKMAVDLKVEFHDEDLMAYNTVAEIPGTDLKHELVMLGGHMDSWHSGTGATDNGAGVSVRHGSRAHPQGT